VKHNFAPSLISFFQKTVSTYLPLADLKILDIGAGNFSLFENLPPENNLVDALDIRIVENYRSENGISYFQGNIVDSSCLKNMFYDLVFDSHCLHCLKNRDDQEIALENIYNSLKLNGIFATEIMVQPSGNKVLFPMRQVGESIEIENLLTSSGFKIIYFVIVPRMSFYFEYDQGEIVCDMLRIVARK
jgi:2-polyprenyl-3-methyl-5-hydroxy-6-metoxy-1,4-benzoquinol methylase